ncbi:DUF805 domain-containing protein [Parasphingorhabdus sp. JC815]|uniref:DUF805 domain-containing protein n=1 Tax=Parasphingorhabdus sp. JC815 TaxID=3232140 RepID=UPI003458788A
MEWMVMPLKRYADFSGRSRRKEYWMFVLLQIIIVVGITIIGGVLGGFSSDVSGGMPFGGGLMMGLFGLYFLAIIIPSIAVQVRRFHDQDKSGWFVLLNFVPYIGGLIVFIFMCLDGTRGKNRFGEDPKASETIGDVFE